MEICLEGMEPEHENTNAPYLAFGTFKPDPQAESRGVKFEEDVKNLRDDIKTDIVKDKFKPQVKQDEDTKKPLRVPYLAFGKFKPDPNAVITLSKQEEKIQVRVKVEQDVMRDTDSLQMDGIKVDDADSGHQDSTATLVQDDMEAVSPVPSPAFRAFKCGVSERTGVEIVEDRVFPLGPHANLHDIDMDVADLPDPLPQAPIAEEQDVLMPAQPDSQDDVNEITLPRQSKRRRVFMDAVVLPNPREVQRRRAAQNAEELEKMEKMKNPKVNMKKVEFCFSVNTIRDRLRPIGLDLYPIDLDSSIRDVMVPRKFLSVVYGGGLQCAWANVAEDTQKRLNNFKYTNFLYLSLDLNCHAPEMPGSPGLYFDAGGEGVAYPIRGTHRLITRIARTPKGPVWQYQGQYKLAPSNPLTTQEWASVNSSVRMNWAEEIWKSAEWGKAARVRISLHKTLGRPCTQKEYKKAFDTKHDYREITADDIAQALLRGEEAVAVWTMKCVGYDAEFQRDLATKYANWAPPPKQKKTGENSNKTKGKKNPKDENASGGKQYQKGQKRKRTVYSDDDSDESDKNDRDEQGEEEDQEELEEYYYRPRGTRSRPIVVD